MDTISTIQTSDTGSDDETNFRVTNAALEDSKRETESFHISVETREGGHKVQAWQTKHMSDPSVPRTCSPRGSDLESENAPMFRFRCKIFDKGTTRSLLTGDCSGAHCVLLHQGMNCKLLERVVKK
jgi:hypothetical protein